MKTVMAKSQQTTERWYVVDAAGKTLGRLASQIAARLRGKCNPLFTPHALTGEHIIVLNAAKIKVSGNKTHNKIYAHYTGYPGGLKTQSFETMLNKFPTRIIEKAVKGMLPKNPLGRMAFKRLKVYAAADHLHAAQKPQLLEIN